MFGPHGQGIAAGVVVEERVELAVAQGRERGGGEGSGIALPGAGAGAPEEVGALEVAAVEPRDRGFSQRSPARVQKPNWWAQAKKKYSSTPGRSRAG